MIRGTVLFCLTIIVITVTVGFANHKRVTRGDDPFIVTLPVPDIWGKTLQLQKENLRLFESLVNVENNQVLRTATLNDYFSRLLLFYVFHVFQLIVIPSCFLLGLVIFEWNFMVPLVFYHFPTAIKELLF